MNTIVASRTVALQSKWGNRLPRFVLGLHLKKKRVLVQTLRARSTGILGHYFAPKLLGQRDIVLYSN